MYCSFTFAVARLSWSHSVCERTVRACQGDGATSAVTFGLSCGAVGVAQRQQGHLNELVEEHVLAHQDELGMFLLAVEVHGVLVVLDHAEHGQHVA